MQVVHPAGGVDGEEDLVGLEQHIGGQASLRGAELPRPLLLHG